MENFSDLIPLLIILGSVIFSAISGARKKKPEVTHETRLPGNIGDEERTFEGHRPPSAPPVREAYQTIQQFKHPEKRDSRTDSSRVPSSHISSKKISSPAQTSPFASSPIQEEGLGQPFMDVSNPDEIRRAIIYTEIFSRKEY